VYLILLSNPWDSIRPSVDNDRKHPPLHHHILLCCTITNHPNATGKNHYKKPCGWLLQMYKYPPQNHNTSQALTLCLQHGLTESLRWEKITLHGEMTFHYLWIVFAVIKGSSHKTKQAHTRGTFRLITVSLQLA